MAKRRKSGTGCLRLRKDGRWEGRYCIGKNANGNPKTKSVFAATKSECEAKLNKLIAEYGAVKTGRIKPNSPFAQWIMYWYRIYCYPNISGNTRASYEGHIRNHIIPAIGEIPLNMLNSSDFQMFYKYLKNHGRLSDVEKYGSGLSNSMVRHCHLVCHQALERAKIEGLIRTNPTTGCKLPPKRSREMNILTKDELRRFLLQAKEECYFEFFLLELATGMRRGEISALRWDDLNTRTGELMIRRSVNRLNGQLEISSPKTKASERTIVLPQTLVGILESYHTNIDSQWMFPSPKIKDAPNDPSTWRSTLSRLLEHAGCSAVRFHDLRHTFATLALEYGMDIKTLSLVIGHTTSATTLDVYAHISDDMFSQAALVIDRSIAKNDVITAENADEEPIPFEYEPYKGKYRKPGTGCISQINEHLFEGRYSPTWIDGKRRTFNVYGHTIEEIETKLSDLIAEKKAERTRLLSEKGKAGINSPP